ncbi:MAG: MFS transporter [Blastocatellia bacterium]|nr:MFS transporter [Blastocatellia bacterium]
MAGEKLNGAKVQVAATAFLSLFSLVGLSFYGLPFFYDFWVRDFGWSRRTITSGNLVGKIVIGTLFGFLIGWLIDRFGPRKLMLVGILLGGFAVIGLSQVSALWIFYLCYMVNALGYVCGGPLPNQVMLSRWFDRARGKAMGFAYLSIGIGGAIVPLLAKSLIEKLGWQSALMVIGILIIVIAFPMVLIVKDPPEGPQASAAAEPPVPISGVVRSWPFYLLAIGSMCSIGAVAGVNQHLKLFLSIDHGYSQADSANVISLVLASSTAGRLLMGWLADRFPKKYVMLLIYALVSLAIPLLYFISTPGVIYVFAVLFGISFGGDYMIIPLMTAELFGLKVMGRIMGIIITADGLAEALSPWIVGNLYDVSKNYVKGFAALIGLAVIGAIAIALLPQRQSDTEG